MKHRKSLFVVIFLLFTFFWATPSSARWYDDYQFGFRINAPENWLSHSFVEGTDRVWAFVSPDQNVAVRVRAFKHDPHSDISMVISLFESEIFGGGQRLALLGHALNGIPGKLGAYQGVYNGNQVGVGAFYTVQNGNAYIIWSIIPTHLFTAGSAEADVVTNTFTLTGKSPSAPTILRWYEDHDFHFKVRIPHRPDHLDPSQRPKRPGQEQSHNPQEGLAFTKLFGRNHS